MYSGKVLVFGQKWFYSGKNSSIRGNWLCSGKNGCIRARWLYLDKVVLFGQSGCNRAKVVVF